MAQDEEKQVKRPSLCHIEISFPVTSDEAALKVKSDISDALKELEQKRIRFSITEG